MSEHDSEDSPKYPTNAWDAVCYVAGAFVWCWLIWCCAGSPGVTP